MDLDLSSRAEGIVLRRSRPIQLDTHIDICRIGPFFSPKARSESSTVLHRSFRGVVVCYWMLRKLGRHFFLRQPVFCFADATFRHWLGRIFRAAGAGLAG